MVRMLCSAGILLAVTAPSLHGQEAQPRNKFGVSVEAPVIAITGEKLIDGTGRPARDNQTIIIRGN
jgi:hypothetical protein